jgi:hypothetical protein
MGPSGKEIKIRRAELAAAVTRAASGDQQALRFGYDATSAKLHPLVPLCRASLDQHGAEIVDVGERGAGDEEVADGIEEGPRIVVGQ